MNENNGSSPNFPDEGTEDEGLEHQDSKNDMTDIAGMKTLTSRDNGKGSAGTWSNRDVLQILSSSQPANISPIVWHT